jgi:predicted phosphodiesterase
MRGERLVHGAFARAGDAFPPRRPATRARRGGGFARGLGTLLLAALPCAVGGAPRGLSAGPWLQQPTGTSVVVMWETTEPTTGVVLHGPGQPLARETRDDRWERVHEVKVEGLAPGQTFFYATRSTTRDGRTFETAPAAFTSAPAPGAPLTFAVVGDTQDQPDVWRRVAVRVWAERPSFLVHCGDIVGDGHDPHEWRDEFFAPARELLAHVPFLAVLGNHEDDSPLYYRYVSNPAPEHRCAFRYGDVEFFLVDSERSLVPGSEQQAWLARAVAASRARWRAVVVHRPPWSSDLDDYGDSTCTRQGEGDPCTRPLVPLLERLGVDLVFCGHVHDYERSWPIRDGRVDEERGVVYVQTGGAGGWRESHAPARSWFTAHVRSCHHFVLVSVCGASLDLKAYDEDGRLFDHWTRRKPARP